MKKVLSPKFFDRPTPKVAQELLGKYLVRRRGKKIFEAMIVEVEAYDGFEDKASHASRGKTPRNFPMFGSAGHWYVYFVYGNHWMLNIVTREKDYPAAVLIRGLKDVSGPGRLTKHFKINKKVNGVVAKKENSLWIEDRGETVSKKKIKATPRIGVEYAGPWKKKPWRFLLK